MCLEPENSFLVIPRGECEFVTKALNAQRLGAQMAIIMDDKQHEKMVIMTDNSYGRARFTQATRSKSPPSSSTTTTDSCSRNWSKMRRGQQ